MELKMSHLNIERNGELSELSMRNLLQDKGYQASRNVYSPGAHSHSVDNIDTAITLNSYGCCS